MALDYQSCIDCKACEVACKEENGVQLGADKQRIWVTQVEKNIFGTPFISLHPSQCNHCLDAPCVDVCPTGSSYFALGGIVMTDKDTCMDRAGLSGDDGPTHHGLFDIGFLRHVPDLIIMQPKDEDEFVDMLHTMAAYNEGPTCIRYPRGPGIGAKPKATPEILTIGKAELISEGSDVCLIGLGHLHEIAVETKSLLEAEGISVTLINPRWIKPLDADLICQQAKKCKVVCTFEDHVLSNGFGASIIELLHDSAISTPVERIGWPDEFIQHGKVPLLREKHGINAQHAIELIQKHLSS